MKKVSVIIPVYNQESLIIRALDSIPIRDDIETIVVDDCSTDSTYSNVARYCVDNLGLKEIKLLRNETNKGVGYTINRGYDEATGEYVVALGSDDYFIGKNFIKILDKLDGTDIVYFNLEINDRTIWRINLETSRHPYVGSVKFIRKDFLGDTRCPQIRATEDYYFYQDLLKKNPTENFTDIVVKHYNFPREGSLTWNALNKEK